MKLETLVKYSIKITFWSVIMIQPKPVFYVCKKCGHVKYHQAKSDCIGAEDIAAIICPKCNALMKTHSNMLSAGLDSIFTITKKVFDK